MTDCHEKDNPAVSDAEYLLDTIEHGSLTQKVLMEHKGKHWEVLLDDKYYGADKTLAGAIREALKDGGYDYGESEFDSIMAVSSPKLVKAARKVHQCNWCGQPINVGESYVKFFWFKMSETHRLHRECSDAGEARERDPEYLTYLSGDRIRDWPKVTTRGCFCGKDSCRCGSAGRREKYKH